MRSLPKPAQYLLRIDDLCPTVQYERWSAIRDAIGEFGIRPILAVVPDNDDESLAQAPPFAGFWEEMRAMQREGATIAMHGYRHTCNIRATGLIRLHRRSEFAGLPLEAQRELIRAGLFLLRKECLTPRLFVAPKHSFDRMTLRAVSEEGIPYLSDGFARVPFLRGGVTWIPQQLWAPESRGAGLWTICIHPNSMPPHRTAELRGFLKKYREQFTSFDDVIANFPQHTLGLGERIYARLAMWRVCLRGKRRLTVSS